MADASIHKILMLVHLAERGEWRKVCDAVETVGKGQKEVGHLKHHLKMRIMMLYSVFLQNKFSSHTRNS